MGVAVVVGLGAGMELEGPLYGLGLAVVCGPLHGARERGLW